MDHFLSSLVAKDGPLPPSPIVNAYRNGSRSLVFDSQFHSVIVHSAPDYMCRFRHLLAPLLSLLMLHTDHFWYQGTGTDFGPRPNTLGQSYGCLFITIPTPQEVCKIENVAKEFQLPQPVLIVRGSLTSPISCSLVVENTVIVKDVTISKVPGLLLAAFYVYNMHFPRAMQHFYTVLEILFLDIRPVKIPIIVSNILALIKFGH